MKVELVAVTRHRLARSDLRTREAPARNFSDEGSWEEERHVRGSWLPNRNGQRAGAVFFWVPSRLRLSPAAVFVERDPYLFEGMAEASRGPSLDARG